MIARAGRLVVLAIALVVEAPAQPAPPETAAPPAEVSPPAPPSAARPAPGAGAQPPAGMAPPTPAPKVLGRSRPAPIEPPAEPEPPGFHVGVVTPQESTVFGRRTRSGGGRRGLGDRARETPATDDAASE